MFVQMPALFGCRQPFVQIPERTALHSYGRTCFDIPVRLVVRMLAQLTIPDGTVERAEQ